jgi:hypothetical protein
MADDRDGYPSSPMVWESGVDHSELRSSHDRPSFQSLAPESVDEHAASHSLSPRESSSVNGHRSPPPKQPWRDDAPAIAIERRDTISSMNSGAPLSLVEPSFDENILRALCELDVCASIECFI